MRSHLAALLLAVLPAMNVLAAPAPPISAILDIGPPPKGETLEQHRSREIRNLTNPNYLLVRRAWRDSEVRKLPSVIEMKAPRVFSWLSENLHVKQDGKGNRLRLTFQAGNRAEQAAILNAVLRNYIQEQMEYRKMAEKKLQLVEEGLPRLKKLIATVTDPVRLDGYLKELQYASSLIVELPVEIARYKKISVIRWAK